MRIELYAQLRAHAQSIFALASYVYMAAVVVLHLK